MQRNERQRALAQFLQTRRARLNPEALGMPTWKRRRSAGLRREEVAALAGISVTWYTWLEQGREVTASEELLERLSQVLRLNADERLHLFTLAGHPLPRDAIAPVVQIQPRLQSLLDALDPCPAHIRNYCWDVLAWNRAEAALITDWGALPSQERNALGNYFNNPHMRQMVNDWEKLGRETTAHFRMDYARSRNDSAFTEHIKNWQRENETFALWWSEHEVQQESGGPLEINHPAVGRLVLERLLVVVEREPLLTMRVLLPLPGTDGREKLEQIIQAYVAK